MQAINYSRGGYDEIRLSSLDPQLKAQVETLVDTAGRAAKVDEHGSWDFGVESNKKGRVESLNWDLYGVGHDIHSGKLLAAIRIRRFFRKKASYYPSIRKNYFLVGENEDATVFAHAVSSAVIRSAIRRDVEVIPAIQNWIFGSDYAGLIRQGDVALIPCSRRPGAPHVANKVHVIEKTHRLDATSLRRDETDLWARRPHMIHLPGTHPEVSGEDRWYKIAVGLRAEFWKFAAPTID
jgi:hypothetical protein